MPLEVHSVVYVDVTVDVELLVVLLGRSFRAQPASHLVEHMVSDV